MRFSVKHRRPVKISLAVVVCLVAGMALSGQTLQPIPTIEAWVVESFENEEIVITQDDGLEGGTGTPEQDKTELNYIPMPLPESSGEHEKSNNSPLGQMQVMDLSTGQVEVVPESNYPKIQGLDDWVHGEGGAYGDFMESDLQGEKNFNVLSRVTDPSAGRAAKHVKLFMDFVNAAGDTLKYVGSGTLVDPYHVITCGHCVFSYNVGSKGDWAKRIKVVPAYNSGEEPFGHAFAGEAYGTELGSWTGWTKDRNLVHDVGVITLNRPVGAIAGWRGYGNEPDCQKFLSTKWFHYGYPAASPYSGAAMFRQYGDFDHCSGFASFDRRSYGGQSGSGAVRDDIVWGVLSNGNNEITNDAKISSTMLGHIRERFSIHKPDKYDLQPLAITSPATSIESGALLRKAGFLVLNYSDSGVSGSWKYTVYLSSNRNISSSDIKLATHGFNTQLRDNGRVLISVPDIRIPYGMQTGTYYLGVVLDAADAKRSNNDSSGEDAFRISVVCPKPDLVQNLTATSDLVMKIRLSWKSATGIDFYSILRNGTEITRTSKTGYEDLSINPNTRYSYQIVAYNECGKKSDAKTVTGSCLPAVVTVWPGDLNDDGRVSAADVLPLARYWGKTGIARVDGSITWKGQEVDIWDPVDATFADADGSGTVDMNDFFAICIHWMNAHSKAGSIQTGPKADIDEETRIRLAQIYSEVRGADSGPQKDIAEYIEKLIGTSPPAAFSVSQNFPNPFNPQTTIFYEIPDEGHVKVVIFGIDGRRVSTLVDDRQGRGSHSVVWNGRDSLGSPVSAGTYFYRVSVNGQTDTRKMTLVK